MIGDQDCTVVSLTLHTRLTRGCLVPAAWGAAPYSFPSQSRYAAALPGAGRPLKSSTVVCRTVRFPSWSSGVKIRFCSAPYVISSSQPYNYFAGKRSGTLILSQPRSKLQLFMSASPKSSCVIVFLVFLFLPESRSRLLEIEISVTDHRLRAEYRYLTTSSPTLSS